MFCQKYQAIISIRCCILRQDIVNQINCGDNKFEYHISTFEKCKACYLGRCIKNNPDPDYDLDVKKLIRLCRPKPERLKLTERPSFRRLELQAVKPKLTMRQTLDNMLNEYECKHTIDISDNNSTVLHRKQCRPKEIKAKVLLK